jgi:hypothetical protein
LSTEQRLHRAKCYLLGCALGEDPGCFRCETHLYDAEFIQIGKLDLFFRAYWWVRRCLRSLAPRRCDVCGKKFMRGYTTYTCSEACFNDWLPF